VGRTQGADREGKLRRWGYNDLLNSNGFTPKGKDTTNLVKEKGENIVMAERRFTISHRQETGEKKKEMNS